MRNTTLWRGAVASVAISLIAFGSPQALAASTASSSASANLVLVDAVSSGLNFDGILFTTSDDSSMIVDGSATATMLPAASAGWTFDSAGFGGDVALDLDASASGSVEPEDFFNLDVLAFGTTTISNTSATDTVTFSFALNYSLSSSASVMNSALDDAFAFSGVELQIDGMTAAIFSTDADALLGPPSDTLAGVFEFSVMLAPGEDVELVLTADSSAYGVALVPVPAALPLMASALIGLAGVARRRKAVV